TMSHEGNYQQPLITNELIIRHGRLCDTATYRMTMNYDGEPGTNGKWGNRHPAAFLPLIATDISILSTNATDAVVKENFALLYVWHAGLEPLKKGDTREVVFLCNRLITGIDSPDTRNEETGLLAEIFPNPASGKVTITYKISGMTDVTIKLFD